MRVRGPAMLLGSVLLAACSAGGGAGSTAEEGDAARRLEYREQLRHELGEAYAQPLPAATGEQLARGASIYESLCQACHGLAGRGNGRSARLLQIQPPDITDPEQAAFFSERAKLHIVANGVPETPMIGWHRMLSEDERLDVTLYMRNLSSPKPIVRGAQVQ